MPKPSEFVRHVLETMRLLGPVEAKAMFGGWGLYHRGAFFALIADDALYLKTDDESRPDFEAAGLAPFVYSMKTGDVTLSYFHAPAEALESPEVMAEWARRGYAAALRARGARKRGGVRKAKPRGGAP
jgi:DNA transformation protein